MSLEVIAMSMESILTSTKKALGIMEDYEHFDPEIIMFINTTFNVLRQLGVGPDEVFTISDKTALWSDFLPEGDIEAVKTYMFLKVKLLFDPPASSFVQQSYQDTIKELEWRMNVMAEPNGYNLS